MINTQAFKNKIRSAKGVLGIFMKTGDPAFVESAGYAGMDFAIFDMEHGPTDYLAVQNHIRAAQIAGITPIVRVKGVSDADISHVLDLGAAGVQVPQVDDPGQVEEVIKAAKYAPQGERGVCRYVRANLYSSGNAQEYFEDANKNSLVIIQLEGLKALDNLEPILDIPGVDIIFIGPYDLSSSLGLIGQVNHPKVVAVMQDIVSCAAVKNVIVGIFADSIETAKFWNKNGVKYIAYSTDVGIFTKAVKEKVEDYKLFCND